MKFWVYLNGEVPGSFTPQELSAMPAFGASTLVCPSEGEILEKNWRHSAEFPELVQALKERGEPDTTERPRPAVEVGDASSAGDLDQLLDSSSNRLFRHVTDLMKELELRREEKSLTGSLQRQIVDLKEQLQQAREKSSILEARLSGISDMEEARRKAETQIRALEAGHRVQEEALAGLRSELEAARTELDNAKRRLNETSSELAVRSKLAEKLSRDLTEKELALAKSLAVIRRFEEDLSRIVPQAAPEAPKPAPPPLPEIPRLKAEPPPAPVPLADERKMELPRKESRLKPVDPSAFTTDEPPKAPPTIEPKAAEQPAAQKALVNFVKKYFGPSVDH